MEETYKDIQGYEGLYQVSNIGNVKRLPTLIKARASSYAKHSGRILKPQNDSYGYYIVCLSKSNKRKTHTIHRLVAKAFLPLSEILGGSVNHIDGNRKNNQLYNLEWVTCRGNSIHGHIRKRGSVGVSRQQGRWIARITINGERKYLGHYKTKQEALDIYNNKAKEIL